MPRSRGFLEEETGHTFQGKASDVNWFYSNSYLIENHCFVSLLHLTIYFSSPPELHAEYMFKKSAHNNDCNLAKEETESRLVSGRVLSRLRVSSTLICFSFLDSGTNQNTLFISARS